MLLNLTACCLVLVWFSVVIVVDCLCLVCFDSGCIGAVLDLLLCLNVLLLGLVW